MQTVVDIVYSKEASEVEKLKAIIASLEQFPDSTRHFLYGYRLWDVSLGEEMGSIGLRIKGLLELLKAALHEAEQREKK